MIKKFTLFLSLALIAPGLMAQTVVFESDFSSWDSGLPTDWGGEKTNLATDSITEITDGVQYGTSGVRIENAENAHKRFTTQPMSVNENSNYLITFYARGEGELRTGIFDDREGSFGYAYNDYLNINNPEWDEYSQAIVAAQDYDQAEFILSIRNTIESSNNIEIDSLSIEESELVIPIASIYDIQFTTDMDGSSDLNGQIVETGGIVTGIHTDNEGEPDGFFIQAGTGIWTGLYVFDQGSNDVARGDSVIVQGTVQEFNDLTELTQLLSFEIISSDNDLPEVAEVSTNEVNAEAYEGVLVNVTNAECTNTEVGYYQFAVDDGSGEVFVDDDMYLYNAQLEFIYDITGIGHYSFGEYKILPRDENDIELLEGSFDEVSIYDIQFTEETGGSSPLENETIITGGIVTAVGESGYFIQNNSGLWQGIYVFDSDNEPARGDSLVLTASVTEFFNMTELENVTNYEVVSSDNPLPAPLDRNTGDLSEEGLEGVLVSTSDGECTEEANEFGEFLVNDGSGEGIIDDRLYLYPAELGNSYDITGIVFYSNAEFKLNPRDEDDVTDNGPVSLEEANAFPTAKLYPNPAKAMVTLDLGNVAGDVHVRVVDVTGKVVMTDQYNSIVNRIDISELASGQYQLIIESEEEGARALRLMVR